MQKKIEEIVGGRVCKTEQGKPRLVLFTTEHFEENVN